MKQVYLVTGCTWPFAPSVWTSKRKARKAAAELRRKLRAQFPITASVYPRSTCGVLIEPCERGSMESFIKIQ